MPRIQTADITALIRERFQIKGAGSIDTLAPEIVGVVDLDPLLRWRSLVPDILESQAAPGAGNTLVTTTFSFQRPAWVVGLSIETSTAQQPNVDWVALDATDPAGAGTVKIWAALGANAVVKTGAHALYPNEMPWSFPFFVPGDFDLLFRCRTNAGGAATADLDVYALVEGVR